MMQNNKYAILLSLATIVAFVLLVSFDIDNYIKEFNIVQGTVAIVVIKALFRDLIKWILYILIILGLFLIVYGILRKDPYAWPWLDRVLADISNWSVVGSGLSILMLFIPTVHPNGFAWFSRLVICVLILISIWITLKKNRNSAIITGIAIIFLFSSFLRFYYSTIFFHCLNQTPCT